jgi:hypothetical protein
MNAVNGNVNDGYANTLTVFNHEIRARMRPQRPQLPPTRLSPEQAKGQPRLRVDGRFPIASTDGSLQGTLRPYW